MQHASIYSAPDFGLPQRYHLDKVVRETAHSTVCRGSDRVADTSVILKVFDHDKRGMYLRELTASFGLAHERIVRSLDTFQTDDGRACIVYDFIAGGTLAERLALSGPLTRTELIRCLDDLLDALETLHHSGRIHCDIKPENIFIAHHDSGPRYILGDLGAVCFVREAARGGHGIGTPAYMAPERFYDRFVFNSDLYSLGIVAFELISGERPFNGALAVTLCSGAKRQYSVWQLDANCDHTGTALPIGTKHWTCSGGIATWLTSENGLVQLQFAGEPIECGDLQSDAQQFSINANNENFCTATRDGKTLNLKLWANQASTGR